MENNCPVMSTTDHSHVTQVTPLDIKRRELAAAKAVMEPQEREMVEQANKIRQESNVRPLGGVK